MKKIIILSLGCILALTGCGTDEMKNITCTYENTTGGLTTSTKYDIDYSGKNVKSVRITYDYKQNTDNANNTDGVGTGTDGTTFDEQRDNDGIVDGVVGNAIDSIVLGISDTILDVAGVKDRHATVQNTYGNIKGFSSQNTTDTDNSYKVTYVVDYDTISDENLKTLNLARDIDTLRDNYTSQGYSCKE